MNTINYWPTDKSFVEYSRRTEEACESVRLIRYAICNELGEPTFEFIQEQTAFFYCEYEILQDIEVVVAGIQIENTDGIIVYGVNSFQTNSPKAVRASAGNVLRFIFTMALDIAVGPYRIALGFSSLSPEVWSGYCHGDLEYHKDLRDNEIVHSLASGIGPIWVLAAIPGKCKFHGLANLRSSCHISSPIIFDSTDRLSSSARGLEDTSTAKESMGTNHGHSSLIYIASYPRSGNTWVRNIVEFYFGRRSSSLYTEGSNNYTNSGDLFCDHKDAISRFGYKTVHRSLRNGILDIFDNNFRTQLLSSAIPLFIKTHEKPFDSFYAGESIIYITRHPVASIFSYYNYLRLYGEGPISLEDVILGNVPYGSWSDHIEAWLESSCSSPSFVRIFKYEEIFGGHQGLVDHISSISGLDILADVGSFPSFSYWHRLSPAFYRSGKVDNYRDNVSNENLAMIREIHGHTAGKLGYSV